MTAEIYPWKRKEVIGNATLYLGDSREVLPHVGDVNAVFADPPYGVNYKGSDSRHTSADGIGYNAFEDSPMFVSDVCVPIIEQCIAISRSMAVTTGISCSRLYPKPVAEGVIWYPSGANSGPWGFVTHQTIFYYGKCPYLAKRLGRRPTGFATTEPAEKNGHPCPKPIKQMEWLVNRITTTDDWSETVLDPFMGSGTTGVACANMGRRFVGIELDPVYFVIACERIDAAYAQGRLF